MRILMSTLGVEPGPVGGAERQAFRQARELVARGHAVTIVCPWTPGTRSGRRDGVRIVRLPVIPARYARTLTYLPVLFLYVLAQARRFDLVHVHLVNPIADVVALAARVTGAPLYVKVAAGGPRGEVQRLAWLAPFTRRIGFRWAARVQAISAEIEDDLRLIPVDPRRVARIPNGIDAESIRPAEAVERSAARASLGLPGEGPLALYLGRLAGYKGIGDLLEAWPAVHGEATLLIVGEPALDDPVAVPEERPGIVVRGWAADVAPFLRTADLLVQPSHAEGMSNTILEAMAAGLPIVATDVGAAREMLGDDAGVIVPPREPALLAAAIDGLLADPARRAAMGGRGRAIVEERYSIEAVVTRIELAYGEILEEEAR